MQQSKPFLTIPQVARRLGVSYATARTIVLTGDQRVRVGSRWVLPAASLDALVQANRPEAHGRALSIIDVLQKGEAIHA